MASDIELAERESGHEQARDGLAATASNLMAHALEEETISYEEAIHRELEYERSMKMRLSRPSASSGASSKLVVTELECQVSLNNGLLQPSAEREQEYHTAKKIRLLQPSADSRPRSASSQKLPSKPDLSWMKRKTPSLPLPQRPFQGFHDRSLPLRQNQDRQVSSNRQFRGTLPQRLQYQRPSLPRRLYQRPSLQQGQQSKLKESFDRQLLPTQLHEHPSSNKIDPLWCSLCKVPCSNSLNLEQHYQGKKHKDLTMRKESQNLEHTSNEIAPHWCNLCKVPCMNPLNLEQHCQGKKHKAKWEEVFGSKKNGMSGNKPLLCHDCNIWCMNEMALAQHRIGKKHAARLIALQLGLS